MADHVKGEILMATTQSDFVQIQLTPAGAEFAGKALQITNGHFAYKFTPGASVKVLTSEWANVLSKKRVKGLLIFEEVPKPEAQPAAAPAAPIAAAAEPTAEQTELSKLQAQEAEIKAEEEALQSKSVQVQTK
jgi:hypothetical protein